MEGMGEGGQRQSSGATRDATTCSLNLSVFKTLDLSSFILHGSSSKDPYKVFALKPPCTLSKTYNGEVVGLYVENNSCSGALSLLRLFKQVSEKEKNE